MSKGIISPSLIDETERKIWDVDLTLILHGRYGHMEGEAIDSGFVGS